MPGVWVFPGGARRSRGRRGEAGYRACAVRELEEEAGIALPAEEELVLFSRWITPGGGLAALRRLVLPGPRARPHPAQAGRRRDRPTPAGSSRRSALEAQAAGELALAFPTVKQLESLLPFRTSDEALAAHRDARRRADPAQGDRHAGGQPGRPPRRPRLPRLRAQNWRLVARRHARRRAGVFGQVLRSRPRASRRAARLSLSSSMLPEAGRAERRSSRSSPLSASVEPAEGDGFGDVSCLSVRPLPSAAPVTRLGCRCSPTAVIVAVTPTRRGCRSSPRRSSRASGALL